jgi:hypothetical protein
MLVGARLLYALSLGLALLLPGEAVAALCNPRRWALGTGCSGDDEKDCRESQSGEEHRLFRAVEKGRTLHQSALAPRAGCRK